MAAAASAGSALLEAAMESWRMSFQSVHYLLFLPLVVGAYFVLPRRLRNGWLLLASYYFYFFAAPEYLAVLLCGTLFSYVMGRVIDAAKTGRGRQTAMALGIAGLVLGLAFFKYNGLFAAFLSPLFTGAGVAYPGGYFISAKALGISFYTFTAIGYLVDVQRKEVGAEKNLLRYALFLGFFPAVTQGPISRAGGSGGLLAQLAEPDRRFDASRAAGGLRLMAIGFFKKLAVADTLKIYVNAVFGNVEGHAGLSLLLAAVLFAIQLYFDFSGYTDIARGSAELLGITLPQNFATPYFATNFSSFWQRWHISLSSWLQDYIFTPLVWSRWTEKLPAVGKNVKNPPVLSSIAAVFLVSGIWHGDGWCYVIWGGLQAMYRIGEEMLHRKIGKPKKNPPFWQRFGKTAVVLTLWTGSLVFFKTGMDGGGAGDALAFFARLFTGFSPAQTGRDIVAAVGTGFYPNALMIGGFLVFSAGCTALALWADWAQCFRLKGESLAGRIGRLRPVPRWAAYYLLVLGCFAAFIMQSGGFGTASFLYAGY